MASKVFRSGSTVAQSPENVSNTAVYSRQTSLGNQFHLSKKMVKNSQQVNEIEWNTSLPNELNHHQHQHQHQHQQLQLQLQQQQQQKQKEYDIMESNNTNLIEEFTESFSLPNQYNNDLDTHSISTYDNMIKQKIVKTTAALQTAETIQFWDIGGYKILLDRCDNGLKLTTDLKTMIEKRANLEKEYASSLKK
jgi:hypothetical protein